MSDSEQSDGSMYDQIENRIVSEDWVVPLTADVEFWQPGPSGPEKRGETVVSRLLIPLV
jgi:hypothetical protein